ncbi:MAG: tRNA pseudouridine(55) synthase TruB [Catalinimonas sp.]
MEAVLLLDKSEGWTSFDVVKKVRGTLRVKKVGHAGTLDPMATGLLILCTGRLTKQIDRYQAQEKEYVGALKLGVTTASYDRMTPPEQERDAGHITLAAVRAALPALTGEIQQVPPIYSALKVGGERLYKKALRGERVEIRSRAITIHTFEITGFEAPYVRFRVVCSKGTYIRSLAHDLGEVLGVGAHLTALRRTRIGEFDVADALTIDAFVAEHQPTDT